jgi:hypothetical protein
MIIPPLPKIDIEILLNRFYKTSVAKYGDGSYAAGAHQVILTDIVSQMPRHEQDKILKKFEDLEKKMMK